MAMDFLMSDMYPLTSPINTGQTTIPEADDRAAMPVNDATENSKTGIVDAASMNASTKEIFIFLLAALVVAFLLGAM